MSPSLVFVELERVERLELEEGEGHGGGVLSAPRGCNVEKGTGTENFKINMFQ